MQRDLHVGLGSLQWTSTRTASPSPPGSSPPPRSATASAAAASSPRPRSVHARLGGVRARARRVRADRRPHRAGLGRRDRAPAQPDDPDDAFPAERRGMIVGIYGGLAGLAVAIGPLVGGGVTRGSTGTGSSGSTCRSASSPCSSRPAAAREPRPAERARPRPASRSSPAGSSRSCGRCARQPGRVGERRNSRHASPPARPAARLRRLGTRAREPMVPLRLLSQPGVRVGNATTFLMPARSSPAPT